MENFKGTPGNWEGKQTAYNRFEVVDSRGYHVLLAPQASTAEWQAINRANVNLAGAAPELLEALQCLFEHYKALADSGDAGNWRLEDEPAGKKALHAIAKALGKE